MIETYAEFLKSKRAVVHPVGPTVDPSGIHPMLFEFQRDLVRWSIRKGRAAIFADTGLGKTFMQLEWARLVTGKPVLIVAPLSVARQTIREAKKINANPVYSRDGTVHPLTITNYEMLSRFDPADFGAVVLDESSILKSLDGKTRTRLIEMFGGTEYRLCCTATPAPNDIAEIANHAEFLGIMRRVEMLASFFIHDQDGWRLKGHAEDPFYRWLASWGMSVRKPSDLGYSDDGYILPPLEVVPMFVETEAKPDGLLFWSGLKGITERSEIRRKTLTERTSAAVSLVKHENAQYNISDETNRRSPEWATQGLHEGVGSKEQGSHQGVPRCDQGKAERQTAADLRRRRDAKDSDSGAGAPMATGEPQQAEGAAASIIRNDHRRVPLPIGPAKLPMSDLRILGHQQPELLPIGRPLPQGGRSPGIAMHELQPGAREVQGQSKHSSNSGGLPGAQWILWCGLNAEQKAVCAQLDRGGISFSSIDGSTPIEEKQRLVEAWQDGATQVLVSKPKVLGLGMNFQNCHRMAFVGLSDSWEAYYQCIRRCYRFGQTSPVKAYIVLSEAERPIYDNVLGKHRRAEEMRERLVGHVREFGKQEITEDDESQFAYSTATVREDGWTMMLGDSVERLGDVESDSVGLSVFSPPFLSLYTYSATERDLGNSQNDKQFFTHLRYIISHLLRVTIPGRNVCVHIAQVPATLVNHGFIGMKDIRGSTIGEFVDSGFVYHGEVCIDKDPQAQAIRTHSKGLLFTQLKKDASWLRPALADYVLVFRKPGDNPSPIHPDITNDEWIEWARPIWYGIRETDTLNTAVAKENDDDRHICPLQLGTIERCIRLWSNRDDLVLSPFAGIGSEGYVAVKEGRRFVGVELKRSYFWTACTNLRRAADHMEQPRLFAREVADVD